MCGHQLALMQSFRQARCNGNKLIPDIGHTVEALTQPCKPASACATDFDSSMVCCGVHAVALWVQQLHSCCSGAEPGLKLQVQGGFMLLQQGLLRQPHLLFHTHQSLPAPVWYKFEQVGNLILILECVLTGHSIQMPFGEHQNVNNPKSMRGPFVSEPVSQMQFTS